MPDSIKDFKTLLESNRPLARDLVDTLARTWLDVDIDAEVLSSEWDKFADSAEEYSLPISAHSWLAWRIRVPELITEEAGWAPSDNSNYSAQERHPVTGRLVTTLQTNSYWKFLHESGRLGFTVDVDMFGSVSVRIYIHDDSDLNFTTESEKLIKLIEEPNFYEGQVCRVFPTHVEVVPVNDRKVRA